jgi:hypothetical protein
MDTNIIARTLLTILAEHQGPQKRIKRTTLRQECGRRMGLAISDRVMRRSLEELRSGHPRGAWICSDTEDGGGYFEARDLRELESYLDADEARIVHLAQRIRAQRKAAGLAEGGQLRLWKKQANIA